MKWLSVPIQLSFDDTFLRALKDVECESDDETYVKAFNELKKLVIEAYEETKRKSHEWGGENLKCPLKSK